MADPGNRPGGCSFRPDAERVVELVLRTPLLRVSPIGPTWRPPKARTRRPSSLR